MADGKTTVFERRERSATQYTQGLFQRESYWIEKTGGGRGETNLVHTGWRTLEMFGCFSLASEKTD